jgi:MerR family transcriptional regulator, repressor of the yfmOP operon
VNGARRQLRIGDVAELTGTTTRTIRYYEEIGLLPTSGERTRGSHRLYEQADVQRLEELLRLKELLGLSLDELRELVAVENARAELRREWHSGVEDPVRQRQILEQSMSHTARQLELIRRRRGEIARLEQELVAKRRRVRDRLRELDRSPEGVGMRG